MNKLTNTMYNYTNIVSVDVEKDSNGIAVCLAGRGRFKWQVEITNFTDATRAFEYNSTLCFEGDAKDWKNLSNVSTTKELKVGEKTVVTISEYGFAGTMAVSYVKNNHRYVFYAYDLDASGTMTKKENDIDLNAEESSCISEKTLITLADGSQKKVKDLTGNEMLLVWNLETGKYESAPILFIDKHEKAKYEVITLHFSNGEKVEVIGEHGFFDINLGEYIYLGSNAEEFIGHEFITKSNKNKMSTAKLKKVQINERTVTPMSPATYGNLCYFVNGMLSMPSGLTGLFNYFEVDTKTMMYDKEKMQNDIETYGLLTYEELSEMVPGLTQTLFDAVNGKYLKVAIGKGIISLEDLTELASKYVNYFNDLEIYI